MIRPTKSIMPKLKRIVAHAARKVLHVGHALSRRAQRTGEAQAATGILAPILALGGATLVAGLAILLAPFGLAHILLIVGVSLTGSAAAFAIARRFERKPASGDLARVSVLGERLERGIERLKDLQWELSDNEARYRELLDGQTLDWSNNPNVDSTWTFTNLG